MKKITGAIKWWLGGSLMLACAGFLVAMTFTIWAPSSGREPNTTPAMDSDQTREIVVSGLVDKGWTEQQAACFADVVTRQSDELGTAGAAGLARKICPPA